MLEGLLGDTYSRRKRMSGPVRGRIILRSSFLVAVGGTKEMTERRKLMCWGSATPIVFLAENYRRRSRSNMEKLVISPLIPAVVVQTRATQFQRQHNRLVHKYNWRVMNSSRLREVTQLRKAAARLSDGGLPPINEGNKAEVDKNTSA
eukprot:TRINITY_DN102026_c0_g1_i1.p1 TRINITY_DN102026_c0_g1~~TRINITY_DN102026_c0_g1_i1.p1  ORF type:complete len:148 (+),score=4.32 TRINITY_DN102026_c0_g1_i1:430-873(+)